MITYNFSDTPALIIFSVVVTIGLIASFFIAKRLYRRNERPNEPSDYLSTEEKVTGERTEIIYYSNFRVQIPSRNNAEAVLTIPRGLSIADLDMLNKVLKKTLRSCRKVLKGNKQISMLDDFAKTKARTAMIYLVMVWLANWGMLYVIRGIFAHFGVPAWLCWFSATGVQVIYTGFIFEWYYRKLFLTEEN